MILVLRYTDRDGEFRCQQIDARQDVLSVTIPEQPAEGLPELTVDVNSDAVIVSVRGRVRHMVTFAEALEE